MIEIRWAQLDDIQELGFVHSEAYRNAYQGIIPDEYLNQVTPKVREEYFYRALTQGEERVAIAVIDKKTVGCMVLKSCSDDDLQSHSGEIAAIYLLKKHRGIGLGEMLLKWGIEKLKAIGCTKVVVWVLRENLNAIRFYERQGFVRDGAERLINRGKELIQFRYIWSIKKMERINPLSLDTSSLLLI
ncbi:GNAT family N-acetyltransferase [Paenibacillus allorhizosphaerae]|uniref:Mycothiol acetyltransferase n=1 Tax=Paenibacillus allorhizosphaerae TaxID=2849866 RepID=A0ABN7TWD8_9BACL|nr:GNAT family N-acetyltransferase [Paenibacillus allorhizosphaerae]CAG7658341.1 Mycothiol acetyltransferase [Paenibacillus allorhizosphaerae]